MKHSVTLFLTVGLQFISLAIRGFTAQLGCDAIDSSSNHHDGAFVGTPTPECVDGVNGGGLLFDGTQNFVGVPNDAALYPQNAFTLECWIKTTAAGTADGFLGNRSSNTGYQLLINSDQHHIFFSGAFQNTPQFGISNFKQVTDGIWHHFAVTWDGATGLLRAYTDGVLGETKSTAGPLVVGSLPFTIGKAGTAFPLFGPVTIDEVRISDVVRYTGNFTPQPSYDVDVNTVAYWSFGDMQPPTTDCSASDSSSNHHDGAFVGDPLPDCIAGVSDSAVRFDGIQNFVSVPNDAALYPQNAFTLECWIKTTAAGTADGFLGNRSSNTGYQLLINSDQHHIFFSGAFQNTPQLGISNFKQVTDGIWHHFAVTWDGATGLLRAYTDGVLGETKSTAGPLVIGTLPFTIGKAGTLFPTFGPITLDEIRLSDMVRYTGTFTPPTSYVVDNNTVAYWKFSACVIDTDPPSIVCPGSIVVTNAPGQCSAVVLYNVTASDTCSEIASLTEDYPSGSSFSEGTTTVTATAVDTAGNTNACSFAVTVVDGEAPRVNCRPAPNPSGKISIPGKNGETGVNPSGYYQLLAKDNCDVNLAIYVEDTGSAFVAGPFSVGDIVRVKHTGGTPSWTPGTLPVVAIINLNGDGLAVAQDSSGNMTRDADGCLMQ